MSNPKRATKPAKPAKPAEKPAPAVIESAEAPAPFTPKESRRLLRVNRFLVKIADPDLARARTRAAYTSADHQEGWRLYRIAAGEGQPLDAAAPQPQARTGLLQHLDDFENKWFPRTRRVIERFVAGEHREGLVTAFFRDLQQQPLGPLVVGSVGTFLDRVEALEKSDVPGAAKARAVLADRGLDGAHVARMRRLLDEARALQEVSGEPAAATASDPAAALRARRTAYESLWLWWKDWRETFSSEVDGRLRRELGLVSTARKGAPEEATDGDDTDDDP